MFYFTAVEGTSTVFTALCAVVTLLRDLFAQAFPEYSTLQRETGERSSSEEQLWSYTDVGLKPEACPYYFCDLG